MDIEGLLRSLNARCVDYVIIGATAFPVHGYSRATLDVDIFIRPERANAGRAMAALAEFGYDLGDLTVDDMLANKVLIRQYVVETDVHPWVKGVEFEGVWSRRVVDRIGDVPAAFASLTDLIAMKRAAGRPKDLEDLKYLEELERRRG